MPNRLSSFQIADDDTVIVRNPRFVEAVPALLDSTPKQVVYNYLFFRAASAGMTSLDKRAREISQEYSAAAQGTKAEKPLWKQCLQEVGYQTRGQVRNFFCSLRFVSFSLFNVSLLPFSTFITRWGIWLSIQISDLQSSNASKKTLRSDTKSRRTNLPKKSFFFLLLLPQGLSIIAASQYVRRFFKAEATAQMDEMVLLIREAFQEKLSNAEWMDDETRLLQSVF